MTRLPALRGAIYGAAIGDALGAGYEYGCAELPADGRPRMIGGGLGNFTPGEWTDDTAMAMAVLRGITPSAPPPSRINTDRIAAGFADWFSTRPPDVGGHTGYVLTTATDATAAAMTAAARTHMRSAPSVSNGSIMRTGPVGAAFPDLTDLSGVPTVAHAAAAVSALTHAEPVAQEACAIWSVLVWAGTVMGADAWAYRHKLAAAALEALDSPNHDLWSQVTVRADNNPAAAFQPNGSAINCLAGAWAAIAAARRSTGRAEPDREAFFTAAVTNAVMADGDTDTVAAVTGALAGALVTDAALPNEWLSMVHGWPYTPATGTSAVHADIDQRIIAIAAAGEKA